MDKHLAPLLTVFISITASVTCHLTPTNTVFVGVKWQQCLDSAVLADIYIIMRKRILMHNDANIQINDSAVIQLLGSNRHLNTFHTSIMQQKHHISRGYHKCPNKRFSKFSISKTILAYNLHEPVYAHIYIYKWNLSIEWRLNPLISCPVVQVTMLHMIKWSTYFLVGFRWQPIHIHRCFPIL